MAKLKFRVWPRACRVERPRRALHVDQNRRRCRYELGLLVGSACCVEILEVNRRKNGVGPLPKTPDCRYDMCMTQMVADRAEQVLEVLLDQRERA